MFSTPGAPAGFARARPFSPELLDLLEDHILLSSVAQETRDMIRILAQVFKSRGDSVPFITPADFFVDGDSEEVQTLVDSISVQAGQVDARVRYEFRSRSKLRTA